MATKNNFHSSRRGQGKRFPAKRDRFNKKKIFTKKKTQGELVEEEIKELSSRYDQVDSSQLDLFKDFPLSNKTKKGLELAGYTKPTEIQRESILLALQGNDILGAAKTGSGKTLAFLIPVLECLFRLKWSAEDGLGALIITPTRELAYQIYEVLRKVGKAHDFSAGLVIGGKHLREESERIQRTNIVICTPGRLQQHLDETPYFTADHLQVLVLDEADRILDLGFQQCMNAIIENLPTERQTLLFSATQTRSVKDLARLSLKDPMYVSVHEMSQHSTPANLRQSYIVCELHEKLDILWSFLKNHLKTKILVFMTSCKQVRYVYETFKRLHPGMTVLCLHGAMQQLKRVAIYDAFCRKQHAVLFATDIAARGLDFPSVNWVLQLDCPEDANTYIHRAGRTARYEKDGEALLILVPSEEEGMIEQLQEKKIPISKIQVNTKKMTSIKKKLESLCASDVTLKEFAQRGFVSYMKAVFLMKNKKIFDVSKLDTDSYAESLGLAIPPRVRFIQRKTKKFANKESVSDDMSNVFTSTKETLANMRENKADNESEEEESESEEEESDNEAMEKLAQMKKASKDRLNFDIGEDDLDDILVKKNASNLDDEDGEEEEEEVVPISELKSGAKKGKVTKAKLAKKLQKKNIKVNTQIIYDDDGQEVEDKLHKAQAVVPEEEEEEEEETGGINLELAKKRLQEEDKIDKELYRERIKKRHKEKRLKEKEARRKQKRAEAGLESESEDEGPDLSLVPDPDKIYGPKADSDKDDDGENGGDDDENVGPPMKKRKQESSEDEMEEDDAEDSEEQSESGQSESERSESEGDNDTGLSLKDDEALALKLLG